MVKSKARKRTPKAVAKTLGKPASKVTKNSADKTPPKSPTVPPSSSTSAGTAAGSAKLNGNGQPRPAHLPGAHLSASEQAIGTIKSNSGIDLTEKIKELVRLAQEQGYLTYNDINDALPDTVVTAEELDDIYIKLRGLEVEIVDQAEVDRVKQPEPEEEEDKSRLDILDDPVRMYLKQMGQVPLLTREQEVEISKRIEQAENEVKRIVYGFGFAGKEHIALAEKLASEPPKERFDRVVLDKKIDGREGHLRALRKLIKAVRALDRQVDENYAAWQNGATKAGRDRLWTRLKKVDRRLQS